MAINNDMTNAEDAENGIYTGINRLNININPFNAYKKWNIYSGSATSSVLPLTAIYSDTKYLPALGSTLVNNDPRNIDNSLQTITYFSINHLFYKRKGTYFTFGPDNENEIKKFLYQSASVFSFPGKKVGLGIKPTSFTYTNGTCSLKDDKYGNVYNTAINTSSIIDNVMYYEGFNEYFDTSRIKSEYKNVTFVPGVTLTGSLVPSMANIGLAARFNGDGYIKQNIPGNYDRDNNFAISFFISASNPTGFGDNRLILGKLNNPYMAIYPFKIELTPDARISFSSAAGVNIKGEITSSQLNPGWQHVVCQKSGSNMEIYINAGTPVTASNAAYGKTNSSTFAQSGYINNAYPLFIGGGSTNTSNLKADLDEIRIFNKTLSTSNISALNDRSIAGGCLQTNIVGNVFYDQGIVVISSPNPIYNNIINTQYNASYRSTVKLHELTILIRVPADRYTLSANRTLTLDNGSTIASFVTGSTFSPYITTIGLYNDFNELVAVAKLAQPIKKRNDLDLNFLIRLDLDQPWS